MKSYIPHFLVLLTLLFISSCSLLEGIFKAGFWSGILLVVAVIGLIIYFVNKARK